jgi:hypothetical protein
MALAKNILSQWSNLIRGTSSTRKVVARAFDQAGVVLVEMWNFDTASALTRSVPSIRHPTRMGNARQ